MYPGLSMHFRLGRHVRRLCDALLPGACLLCGGPSDDQAVCAGCRGDLPLLASPACPVCAAPLGFPATACGTCLGKPPAFDASHAAWRYSYPVDRLLQLLKFGHGAIGRRFASADFCAQTLLAGSLPEGDMIVPVPLAPLRLRGRGFNQALEIARPLARARGLPLDSRSLTRTRETEAQSRLPWRARRGNVRHAFACSRDFTGLSVIVVDDVMTTGATLDAVARTLKDHGAVRVANWVVARAVKTRSTERQTPI